MPKAARHVQLTRFAAQLLQAARARDWAALETADREVARSLPQLAAQGDWTPAEQAALQQLGQAHNAAREVCSAAGQALAQHIQQLQTGRDGWLAYAQHSSLTESRP